MSGGVAKAGFKFDQEVLVAGRLGHVGMHTAAWESDDKDRSEER